MKTIIFLLLFSVQALGQSVPADTVNLSYFVDIPDTLFLISGRGMESRSDTVSTEKGWLVYLSSHGRIIVRKNAKAYTISAITVASGVSYTSYVEYETAKGERINHNSVIHFKPNNL